ncbi:hypothetical protein KJ596_04450 [Patescibacteria group bacterium]|nr:hypothetical protein [Patescibacteria group bacterium]MBU1868026.1 hypothetical protein [Patescibacteria group bacterium]
MVAIRDLQREFSRWLRTIACVFLVSLIFLTTWSVLPSFFRGLWEGLSFFMIGLFTIVPGMVVLVILAIIAAAALSEVLERLGKLGLPKFLYYVLLGIGLLAIAALCCAGAAALFYHIVNPLVGRYAPWWYQY